MQFGETSEASADLFAHSKHMWISNGGNEVEGSSMIVLAVEQEGKGGGG